MRDKTDYIVVAFFSFLFNVIFRRILHKYTNDVSFGYWLIGLDVEHVCASKCKIITSNRLGIQVHE
jgi:hypothetical protein